MVDIHCHLLHGVDDGSKDLNQSLEMIRGGLEDGIEVAVVTPHILDGINEEADRFFKDRFKELVEEVRKEELPLRLFLGSEIMFQFGLYAIGELEVTTFNGNRRYFLIEAPLHFFPDQFEEVIFKLRISGLTPILAHPERNAMLTMDPERIYRLADQEILFQINAGSLIENRRSPERRIAEDLIRRGLVHFVASDAHDTSSRPFVLSRAREVIEELAGAEVARRLFFTNPWKAIKGERIEADVASRAVQEQQLGKAVRSGILRNIWRKFLSGRA